MTIDTVSHASVAPHGPRPCVARCEHETATDVQPRSARSR
jgi:hypothetical protein